MPVSCRPHRDPPADRGAAFTDRDDGARSIETETPPPFPLLELPDELSTCGGWTREVYADLLALQAGRVSRSAFDAKYRYRTAILTLDLTGFTVSCFEHGETAAFQRIMDAHKVCIPALREKRPTLVRAFADDLVALFEEASQALDAALELHRRVALFSEQCLVGAEPIECCVGIGYGDVYAFGPNRAMGDEMNRASKLGEDIARGGETLVTQCAFEVLRDRTDVVFERIAEDDMLFPYYRARGGGTR